MSFVLQRGSRPGKDWGTDGGEAAHGTVPDMIIVVPSAGLALCCLLAGLRRHGAGGFDFDFRR